MYNPNNLEYIVGSSYMADYNPGIAYFSKSTVDKYAFVRNPMPELFYIPSPGSNFSETYSQKEEHYHNYFHSNELSPSIFLSPSRPKSKFVEDSNEARKIAEEVFRLMANKELQKAISINVLPLNDFRLIHSQFGRWNGGILGFSINGKNKLVFVREGSLDSMIIVLGHELGHILTESLPNKHDEEAKAFAFSVEWAKTIKKFNVAGLADSIADEIDFAPAKNGLHDVAFSFVNIMAGKRKPMELHDDLVKGYRSIFGLYN